MSRNTDIFAVGCIVVFSLVTSAVSSVTSLPVWNAPPAIERRIHDGLEPQLMRIQERIEPRLQQMQERIEERIDSSVECAVSKIARY